NPSEAAKYFLIASKSTDAQIKNSALRGYEYTQVSAAKTKISQELKRTHVSEDVILLDQFYILKKNNTQAAWQLIKKITEKYPLNVVALKEAGYLAIEKGYRTEAITYLTQAYQLTLDPNLAMQLGYLYDLSGNKFL